MDESKVWRSVLGILKQICDWAISSIEIDIPSCVIEKGTTAPHYPYKSLVPLMPFFLIVDMTTLAVQISDDKHILGVLVPKAGTFMNAVRLENFGLTVSEQECPS